MTSTLLCYVRRSYMPNENASISPEQQQVAIRTLVEIRGFTCEWYIDAEGHRSGLSEDGRPEWLRLKEQLDREDVAGVAAYDLSRIYRNTRDFLEFVDTLERLKKRIVLVHDLIDTGTAAGRMLATVLVAMYEMEARKTSERVTANIAYKRRKQGKHWGPIPFGCERIEGVLHPDPDVIYVTHPTTGETVARPFHDALVLAYRLFAAGGHSCERVADELNAEGWYFKNRKGEGRTWTVDDARRILSAWQLYAGNLPLGRQKDKPVEIIAGAHAPIVDPALCQLVGDELQKRARAYTSHGQRHSHLLTGLLYCTECGRALVGNTQDGQRIYRHRASCKRPVWIDAERLEQIALSWCDRLYTQEIIESVYAALDALAPTAGNVRQNIIKLEGFSQRLTAAYLAGKVPEAKYRAASEKVEADLAVAREQLPADISAIMGVISRFRDLTTGIELLGRQEQKDILHSLFTRIEVSGDPLKGGRLVHIEPAPWLAPLWPFIWRNSPELRKYCQD